MHYKSHEFHRIILLMRIHTPGNNQGILAEAHSTDNRFATKLKSIFGSSEKWPTTGPQTHPNESNDGRWRAVHKMKISIFRRSRCINSFRNVSNTISASEACRCRNRQLFVSFCHGFEGNRAYEIIQLSTAINVPIARRFSISSSFLSASIVVVVDVCVIQLASLSCSVVYSDPYTHTMMAPTSSTRAEFISLCLSS